MVTGTCGVAKVSAPLASSTKRTVPASTISWAHAAARWARNNPAGTDSAVKLGVLRPGVRSAGRDSVTPVPVRSGDRGDRVLNECESDLAAGEGCCLFEGGRTFRSLEFSAELLAVAHLRGDHLLPRAERELSQFL